MDEYTNDNDFADIEDEMSMDADAWIAKMLG